MRVNRLSSVGPAQILRDAFTLIELLVVVGIIALLISILLPVVGRIRIAGQRVATQNTINRLSQACEAYFSDFNSYPGPFSNDQLVPSFTGAPTILVDGKNLPLQFSNNGVVTALTKGITSSENLFIGLCGGLKFAYVSAKINGFVFDQDAAKQASGPRGLNPNQAKKFQSYMEIAPADYSGDASALNPLQPPGAIPAMAPNNNPGMWWRAAGLTAGDSELYEFVDRFRIPQPILYMRANRGGDPFMGVDTNGDGDVTGTEVGNYGNPQYYIPQITRTYASVLHNANDDANRVVGYDSMNPADPAKQYWHANTTDYRQVNDNSGNKLLDAGDEAYFGNSELSTSNGTVIKKIARHKDSFVLISAGPDGIYGTADDIRN